MSVITSLEQRIKDLIGRIDGEALHVEQEAKAELLKELAVLKADAAAVKTELSPVLAQAETDLKNLVSEAGPAVLSAVEARFGELVRVLEGLLGKL